MNDVLKEHLISAGNTFVTIFLVSISATLSTGGVQWTGAFWLSVLSVAVRAAIKEVLARSLPISLGGRK